MAIPKWTEVINDEDYLDLGELQRRRVREYYLDKYYKPHAESPEEWDRFHDWFSENTDYEVSDDYNPKKDEEDGVTPYLKAFLYGGAKGLTGGWWGPGGIEKYYETEDEKELMMDMGMPTQRKWGYINAAEENPITAFLGEATGFVAPLGVFSKIAYIPKALRGAAYLAKAPWLARMAKLGVRGSQVGAMYGFFRKPSKERYEGVMPWEVDWADKEWWLDQAQDVLFDAGIFAGADMALGAWGARKLYKAGKDLKGAQEHVNKMAAELLKAPKAPSWPKRIEYQEAVQTSNALLAEMIRAGGEKVPQPLLGHLMREPVGAYTKGPLAQLSKRAMDRRMNVSRAKNLLEGMTDLVKDLGITPEDAMTKTALQDKAAPVLQKLSSTIKELDFIKQTAPELLPKELKQRLENAVLAGSDAEKFVGDLLKFIARPEVTENVKRRFAEGAYAMLQAKTFVRLSGTYGKDLVTMGERAFIKHDALVNYGSLWARRIGDAFERFGKEGLEEGWKKRLSYYMHGKDAQWIADQGMGELAPLEMEIGSWMRTHFDELFDLLTSKGVVMEFRENYLPLIWRNKEKDIVEFARATRDKWLKNVTVPMRQNLSQAFRHAKRRTLDLDEGLLGKMKPVEDPVVLMQGYFRAAFKTLANRNLADTLLAMQILWKGKMVRAMLPAIGKIPEAAAAWKPLNISGLGQMRVAPHLYNMAKDVFDPAIRPGEYRLYKGIRSIRNHVKRWIMYNPWIHGSNILCLPEDAQILTKDGWKNHWDLNDDEVLTYKDGKLKWKRSKGKNVQEYAGPMVSVKMRNDRDLLMTPNHKCLVHNKITHQWEIREAQDLCLSSRIPTFGNYEFPSIESIDDRLVKIIGWLVTDGCLTHNKWGSPYGVIYQSKPKGIEDLLTLGLSSRIQKIKNQRRYYNGKLVKNNFNKQYVFHVPKDTIDRMKSFGIKEGNKVLTWDFLSVLTKDQMQILYDTLMLGDGCKSDQDIFIGVRKSLDMMAIVSLLLSKRISYSKNTTQLMISKTPKMISFGGKHRLDTVKFDGKVWCPLFDEPSFWIAKYNGNVFVTGNSDVLNETLTWKPWKGFGIPKAVGIFARGPRATRGEAGRAAYDALLDRFVLAGGDMTTLARTGSELFEHLRGTALDNVPAGNFISKAYGATKGAVDRFLWEKLVANSQLGLFDHTVGILARKHKHLTAKTVDRLAAHYVNDLLGTLPRHVFTNISREGLSTLFFARNWTISNLRLLSGAAGIRGRMGFLRHKGLAKEEMRILQELYAKHVLRGVAMLVSSASLFQVSTLAMTNKLKEDGHLDTKIHGPVEEIRGTFSNDENHRLDVDTGLRDKRGNKIYMANFLFRYIGDYIKWLTDPSKTLWNKMEPVLKSTLEMGMNYSLWQRKVIAPRGEMVAIKQALEAKGVPTFVAGPAGDITVRAVEGGKYVLMNATPLDDIIGTPGYQRGVWEVVLPLVTGSYIRRGLVLDISSWKTLRRDDKVKFWRDLSDKERRDLRRGMREGVIRGPGAFKLLELRQKLSYERDKIDQQIDELLQDGRWDDAIRLVRETGRYISPEGLRRKYIRYRAQIDAARRKRRKQEKEKGIPGREFIY